MLTEAELEHIKKSGGGASTKVYYLFDFLG